MRPKGKLFALLAVFAAIGLITASGAFTTVSADRSADVQTSGDSSALLAMEPHGSSSNGAYATTSGNQLEISLTEANLDATTEIDLVFNITNNGQQDVYLWITRTGANSDLVGFYNGTVSSGSNITTSSNRDVVSPGETIEVSIEIDTTDSGLTGSDELLSEITIHADESDPNA